MKYSLAVDIGASSGRHIVGWQENGALRTEEVYRFPNGVAELDGHLAWDVGALDSHVRAGMEKALQKYTQIESLSVDTWGVDYVLMRGDEPVYPCYAYRDWRTEAVHEEVHAGEAAAAAGFVGGPSAFADLVRLGFRDVCGDEGLALGVVVFGVVVVEDRVRDDLADGGGEERLVAQDGSLQLAGVYALLGDDAEIVLCGELKGRDELVRAFDAGDAYR